MTGLLWIVDDYLPVGSATLLWIDDYLGPHCHLSGSRLECFERRRYPR